MAKKPTNQPERIRCADCVHGKPHKGLAVREGLNVEEHLKRFKEKDNIPPGYIPWF